MLVFLGGIYVGGLVASAPWALGVGRGRLALIAFLSVGWPVAGLGMMTGAIRLAGGVGDRS